MTRLPPHRVSAFNLAKNSENGMHDDVVAQRFGFKGGLVPGVDVFAYMSHMPVERWGRAFLERGSMGVRFLNPIYDGEIAEVTAIESGDCLEISVESRGEICATGHASLAASATGISVADFQAVDPVVKREPVDEQSYAIGRWLGIPPYTQGAEAAVEYLRDIRETAAVFADEHILHPGMLLRAMNWALMENAILGPWIHVGSSVQYLCAALVTDAITVRARVAGNYERKGHLFVELDGLIVANGGTPIARCQHTAIYQPREAIAA